MLLMSAEVLRYSSLQELLLLLLGAANTHRWSSAPSELRCTLEYSTAPFSMRTKIASVCC